MAKKSKVFRGDRLIEMRKLKEVTQEELSDYTGISTGQLSRYENGHTDPTSAILKKMAEKLDCTTDYLLGLSDDPETSYRPDKKISVQAQKLLAKFEAGLLDELANELLSESIRRKKSNSSDDSESDDKDLPSQMAQ